MSVLTVVANDEPTAQPPRIRVNITDSGTPAVTGVTVTRTDPDGNIVIVRDADNVALTPSATVYDYEVPFGVPMVYSTFQQPGAVSAPETLNSDVPWLLHPGIRALSQPIDLVAGSFAERSRAARVGVFWPLGRDTAVAVSDGRRKRPESDFTIATESEQEFRAFESLLDDSGVLLLNVPPSLGLLVDSAYIQVTDLAEVRPSEIGSDVLRHWRVSYVEVARPTGGAAISWTWADVMTRYKTWRDVMNDNRTWANVLDPST